MCLAVPMELKSVRGTTGVVRMGGMCKEIRLDLVEDPEPGDFLIVHAGFAIEKLDRKEAEETLALFRKAEGS